MHGDDKPLSHSNEITRRESISAIGSITGALAIGVTAHPAIAAPANKSTGQNLISTELVINGQRRRMKLDPRITLLDLLREELGLTGTKKGCDHGQCGACTVLANGRRINSCLSLAASHDGDQITTVEGLAHGADLDPVQAAFIEHDGLQCGYCTPGQVCSAVALLAEARRGDASWATADVRQLAPVELTDREVRERMSGNLCRCGAYPGIVAAVQAAAGAEPTASRMKEKQ